MTTNPNRRIQAEGGASSLSLLLQRNLQNAGNNNDVDAIGNARIDTEWLQSASIFGGIATTKSSRRRSLSSMLDRHRGGRSIDESVEAKHDNDDDARFLMKPPPSNNNPNKRRKRNSIGYSSSCSTSGSNDVEQDDDDAIYKSLMMELEPTPIGPRESIQVVRPQQQPPAMSVDGHYHQPPPPQEFSFTSDMSKLAPSLLECLRPLLLLPSSASTTTTTTTTTTQDGTTKPKTTCTNTAVKKMMTDPDSKLLSQHQHPASGVGTRTTRTTTTTSKSLRTTSDVGTSFNKIFPSKTSAIKRNSKSLLPHTTTTSHHRRDELEESSDSILDATSDNESYTSSTATTSCRTTRSSSATAAATGDNVMEVTTSRVIMRAAETESAAAAAAASLKKGKRFRMSQAEQWGERFKELIQFKQENGHCVVPLCYPTNPTLSHWVKRQRCQYKLKHAGKRSTLTDDREMLLEDLGFTWDSHNASWEERFYDLVKFKKETGHCNVPSTYPSNPSLAGWIKCQRRYVRMFYKHQPQQGHTTKLPYDRGDNYDTEGRLDNTNKDITSASKDDAEYTSDTTSVATATAGIRSSSSATTSSSQLKKTMRYSLNSDRVNRLVELGLRWKKNNK